MLLSKAGLTNAQIINASTSNAAKIIQQSDKIGQIKLGYEASFLILANNPLVNIENLQNITAVYKSGNVINREQLIAKNQQIIPQGKACHVSNESISANKVIDDFSGKSPWNESSDIIMGGESTTKLTVKESSLLISTSIGKPTNFGAWAGAEIKFPQQIDASKFQGITITYKGSATPFSLSIYHAEVKDWDHFSTLLAPSNEWTTVNLAFENFKQFGFGNQILWSASKLTGLNIMWRKAPGAASTKLNNELVIKELTFY